MFLTAIVLIIMGISIAIYPELLSIIVASFLIFLGIILLYLRFYFRRVSRDFQNPFMDFFIRH